MANIEIYQLPEKTAVEGGEIIEIQDGTGVGSSKHLDLQAAVMDALRFDQISREYASVTGGVHPTLALIPSPTLPAPSNLSVTRATTATYYDSKGILRTASNNELRGDHDPSTGEFLGWLIEESRTNLLTYSEDFADTGWGEAEVTVSADASISPDGSSTADKLIPSVTNAGHKIVSGAVSVTSGTQYTISVFAKAAGYSFLRISGENTGFSATDYSVFDLSTGAVGVTNSVDATDIKDVGNGFYRCSITITATATAIGVVALYVCDANSIASFAGDGTSGLYLWGAQLEEGPFPTSYIPTTSATVTRAADNVSITGSDFTEFYNQSEGALVSTVSINGFSSTPNPAIEFNDSSSSDYIQTLFSFNKNQKLELVVLSGGLQSVNTAEKNIVADVYYSVGVAYKTNDFALVVDGVVIGTANSGTLPASIDSLDVLPINGHLRSLLYFPRRLPDATLAALTS